MDTGTRDALEFGSWFGLDLEGEPLLSGTFPSVCAGLLSAPSAVPGYSRAPPLGPVAPVTLEGAQQPLLPRSPQRLPRKHFRSWVGAAERGRPWGRPAGLWSPLERLVSGAPSCPSPVCPPDSAVVLEEGSLGDASLPGEPPDLEDLEAPVGTDGSCRTKAYSRVSVLVIGHMPAGSDCPGSPRQGAECRAGALSRWRRAQARGWS